MSEIDNTSEHDHEPVASPTPEPAPEPTPEPTADVAATETVEDAVAAVEPVAEVEAPVEAAPEPVADAVMDHPADMVAESSNAPVGVPESSNAPVEVTAATEPAPVDVSAEPVHEVAAEPLSEPVVEAAAPVEPVAVAEPEPAPEPTPEPVVEAQTVEVVEEAVVTAPVEPEPAPVVVSDPVTEDAVSTDQGIDPTVVAAGVVVAGAAAGAAAASASNTQRPIWSDQGDAPFDDAAPASTSRRSGKPERTERASGGFFAELLDIVRTVIYALLIALVVRVFFFQPFTIPSASMEPNLYEGDYIVVSKWSYGYSRHSMPYSPPLFEGRILGREAARGDIVVFKRPNNDGEGYTDYIKRIIGVPGDTVQMIANQLYINGQPVQDLVVETTQVRGAFEGQTPIQLRETLPGGHEFRIQDFGPGSPSDDTDVFTVPAGHYFVMGDNRDDSMDSRYVWEAGGVGLVPQENLVGKAQIILFSWTPGASLINPVSWFSHARPERFFTNLE